ncbi:hypothetical protein L21SP4_00076 [Kiritimatiella glycovorans]|uniref:Uncharacterized protein n=1 Tax=Kiritimatiella glycovorans TaxID=1307763 RepID=A0A0G3EAS8_9BACT|nr:hypothetical protein L21SP4_00076 [Kiritimatiella glycovorans]
MLEVGNVGREEIALKGRHLLEQEAKFVLGEGGNTEFKGKIDQCIVETLDPESSGPEE